MVAIDNASVGVFVDGGEGAEQEAADVSQGGGPASGDTVAGKKIIKMVERRIDGLSVLETVGLAHGRVKEVGVFVASFFLSEVF